MSFLRQILKVSLSLVLFVTVMGCSTAAALSEEQIVANTLGAYDDISTVKMDMEMTMAMDATGSEEPVNYQMNLKANGAVNIPETEMFMAMTMEMDIPETGAQNMSTDLYVVDNWMYMKLGLGVLGEQWIKSRMDENLWAQQNQLDQQMQLLKSAVKTRSLGKETVDGVECYVLEITPDMAALTNFIGSQLDAQAGADALDEVDLSKVFKSMTVIEWVAAGTCLPTKTEITILMEMNAEDFGSSAEGYEQMTIDMVMTIKYSDYNKPVTIVLPPEAANAIEQSLSE
jgi:hypothetical protein